jgi:hypothetical protein
VLVFGGMLLYLQTMPTDFENRAESFIVDEIDAALAPDSAISRLAQPDGVGSALPADRIDALRMNLAASTRKFIGLVVEALCAGDCRTRDFLEAEILKAYGNIELKLKPGFDILRGMVEAKYHAVFDALRHDIKIFLGANLIVLGFALVLALARGRAGRHLAPLSILLTIATAVTSTWYVFGQNWILTVITADYFGWSYLTFIGVVFLLLADIALNRARVISHLLNTIAEALGSKAYWGPC